MRWLQKRYLHWLFWSGNYITHPILCSPWVLLFAYSKSQFAKALGGWLAGQCLRLLTKDDNLLYSIFTPVILRSAQTYAIMEQVQTLPAFLLKGCGRSCCSLPRNTQREEQRVPWKRWVKENFEHMCIGCPVSVLATKEAPSLSYFLGELSPSISPCVRHMKILRE